MICNNEPGRSIVSADIDSKERYLDTGPASYRCDLNGIVRQYNKAMIPMTDAYGVVKNYAGFQNDITERKEAEAKVAHAREELESFNYTVSHDLQGPLRIMSAFSRILTNDYGDKLGKEGKDYLGFIENNAKQMSKLIKGLLAFSKQGQAALNFGMTDLAAQVAQVIELCRMDAENSKAAIKINPLTPAICDCDLIMQVWTNLISNAIKYSSKHEAPQIEIGQTSDSKGIVYFVRDNGAGFDMKGATKLFRPFQRMHSSSEYEGTGVGLATVHRIITRHGGRIWAEAKKGEGATFFFTLQEASAS